MVPVTGAYYVAKPNNTRKELKISQPSRIAPELRVEGYADLLIVLLYAPGRGGAPLEPVIGTTRLQKLMFLLRQGEGPKSIVQAAKDLGYEPYKMGPFSVELRSTVDELSAAGIVRISPLSYAIPDDADAMMLRTRLDKKSIVSYEYSLTNGVGAQVGTDLWNSLTPDVQSNLQEFKAFFNSLSLRQLLIFTYEKYPDFTEHSTIKRQLGL